MNRDSSKRMLVCFLFGAITACGDAEQPSDACTTIENDDGSVTLQCGEGAPATLTGPVGAQGPGGKDGKTAAIRTETATQEHCTYGGEVIYTGYDEDNNGVLDRGEETQNFILCQNAPEDGKTALVVSSQADLNDCSTGGRRIEVGLDNDQSGTLDSNEVLDVFNVCNGQKGGMGGSGKSALIEITINAAQNCAAGGDLVTVGVDSDGSGTLSAAEVSGTFEVCDGQDGGDGSDGASGLNSLIKVTEEPEGENCPFGGQKLEVGLDQNNNGSLDVFEIDPNQTAYICGAEQPPTFVQVAMGNDHTCAVTASGGVKCWGSNSAGQLGDGSTTDSGMPVDVNGLTSNVVSISAGGAHTCAVTTSGGAKCWGSNVVNQLGDGTTTQRNTPVDVSGLTSNVASISAGGTHTCAVTASGGAKCWGNGISGQLGDGTNAQRNTPVDVSGLTSNVVSISAGGAHTCAVTTSGGAKCWGGSSYGQLGIFFPTDSFTPVDVSGLTSNVVSISAGNYHTCAVTASGGAKCWGWNGRGQLGDGTTTQRNTPVDVGGLTSNVVSISAGSEQTCAVTVSGGAKCFGGNGRGQLGDGTTTNSGMPVDVNGLTSNIASISAGGAHTCAITALGGLKCWGSNDFGQLGNWTTVQRNAPVDVIFP